MIKFALIALMIISSSLPARGERLWLVVGASSHSAAEIARKSRLLAINAPDSLVVQTGDCGDKKNIYAWVAEAAASPEAAQTALARVRTTAKSAYIKRCDVKPATLLALRMTVVDPSIADVPETAVNWTEKDRVSSVHHLPDGRSIVIARYFSPEMDDPLEGRRERVILTGGKQKTAILEENCPSSGLIATFRGKVAFHCVRGEAGVHLIHNVSVFGKNGEKLTEIKGCRNPGWSGESVIECDQESVDSDGQLSLKRKQIRVYLHQKRNEHQMGKEQRKP